MPFKQQSGLVNIPLKQWPYICKKYNHNQLQTKDITLILILGMGIPRRKPVALRNLAILWKGELLLQLLPRQHRGRGRHLYLNWKRFQTVLLAARSLNISH